MKHAIAILILAAAFLAPAVHTHLANIGVCRGCHAAHLIAENSLPPTPK